MTALGIVAAVAAVITILLHLLRLGSDDDSFVGGLVVVVFGAVAVVACVGIVILGVTVGIIQAVAS